MLLGLSIKLTLNVLVYCNVSRINVGKLSDFAFNVPRFLLDKASLICLILLPMTVHIAKKRPDSIHSLSMLCSLLYATTEWMSTLIGSLCALIANV